MYFHFVFQLINDVLKKSAQSHHAVGHEVAGLVTEVGSAVSSVQVGDKVTGKGTVIIIILLMPPLRCLEFKLPHRVRKRRVNSISVL